MAGSVLGLRSARAARVYVALCLMVGSFRAGDRHKQLDALWSGPFLGWRPALSVFAFL